MSSSYSCWLIESINFFVWWTLFFRKRFLRLDRNVVLSLGDFLGEVLWWCVIVEETRIFICLWLLSMLNIFVEFFFWLLRAFVVRIFVCLHRWDHSIRLLSKFFRSLLFPPSSNLIYEHECPTSSVRSIEEHSVLRRETLKHNSHRSGLSFVQIRSNLDCSSQRSFSKDHEEDFDEQKTEEEEEEELQRRSVWWAKGKNGEEEEEDDEKNELLLSEIERCIFPLVSSLVEEEDEMNELDSILVLIPWSSLAFFVHSQLDETFPEQRKHFSLFNEEDWKEDFFQLTFQKEKTETERELKRREEKEDDGRLFICLSLIDSLFGSIIGLRNVISIETCPLSLFSFCWIDDGSSGEFQLRETRFPFGKKESNDDTLQLSSDQRKTFLFQNIFQFHRLNSEKWEKKDEEKNEPIDIWKESLEEWWSLLQRSKEEGFRRIEEDHSSRRIDPKRREEDRHSEFLSNQRQTSIQSPKKKKKKRNEPTKNDLNQGQTHFFKKMKTDGSSPPRISSKHFKDWIDQWGKRRETWEMIGNRSIDVFQKRLNFLHPTFQFHRRILQTNNVSSLLSSLFDWIEFTFK